jgi:hypothetical protein
MSKMKYIFITYSGLGLPIAYKLQQQGFDVTVGVIQDVKDYVTEEEMATATESDFNRKRRVALFKGMVNLQDAHAVIEKMKQIPNPKEYFVFFEENNLYRWADKIRHLDFHGNFPTREDYMFEIDRDMAKQFVAKYYPKLRVPDVKEFSKIADAVEFLRQTNEIWVLKGKHDAAQTFIADSNDPGLAGEQIIEMLTNFPDKYERLGFILELFIPSIIELTPEKMYYDGVPIGTSIGIENKNFGSGNISVQTGCAEDLVFPTDMEDRINKIAFPEIVDEMAKQHKGLFIWDASLLINKKDGKIFFGEFCSNRPGYNSFFTELAQAGSINDFFTNAVNKKPVFKLGTIATSVRIFNLNRDDDTEQVSDGITINYKPEIENDLWLWDAQKNDRGKLVTVGSDWNLAVITGAGKSIDEAINKLYKNIESFSFMGSYYRPKDDYLSLDYPTSIVNRLNYGLERGLYKLPFSVKVGAIIDARHES